MTPRVGGRWLLIWLLEDTIIFFAQFGVLADLQAALAPVGGAQDNDGA